LRDGWTIDDGINNGADDDSLIDVSGVGARLSLGEWENSIDWGAVFCMLRVEVDFCLRLSVL